MQSILNLRIKFRESFRPFAPTVMEEHISDYFDIDRPSPYMLLVAQVRKEITKEVSVGDGDDILARLKQRRSEIPAVTHVDYSARIQSINHEDKADYHDIINEFKKLTGCPVIVNTSFNVRGEPIVCTPEDAYRCFMRTDMDILVLNDRILVKEEQPQWVDREQWQNQYALD